MKWGMPVSGRLDRMPIDTACPHCEQKYKLRDDFAGKKVNCKNCKQSFIVPQSVNAAMPAAQERMAGLPDVPVITDQVDPNADAAALAALADEAPKAEDIPPEGKPIRMVCSACDHVWEVPRLMEGKNVICPDCTSRVRVPIQKEERPKDWRSSGRDRPTLAKGEEAPEGTWTDQTTTVSEKVLVQAGAIQEEAEPVPLLTRIRSGLWIASGIAVLVFGFLFVSRTVSTSRSGNRIDIAISEIEDPTKDGSKRPLLMGAIQVAAAEHMLLAGITTDEQRKECLDHFRKARNLYVKVPATSMERNRALIELAAQMVALGGSKEEVFDEKRISWSDVQQNLRQTLSHLQGTDFDTRLDAVRMLTSALAAKEQFDLVSPIVNPMFNPVPAEQAEVLATIGIAYLQLGLRERAEKAALDALALGDAKLPPPVTRSLQALIMGLGVDGKVPKGRQLPLVGNISDEARIGYAMGFALQGKPDDARKMAERPGSPVSRWRALVMAAELLPIDSAKPLVEDAAKLALNEIRGQTLAPPLMVSLARMLQAIGDTEHAGFIADAIKDESMQAWARLEALRVRLGTGVIGDSVWLDKLGDPKHLAVAIGYQRYARHNELMGDPAVAKLIETWPEGVLRPFGYAGRSLASPVLVGK